MSEAPGFSHVCAPDERSALAEMIPAYEAALVPASARSCRAMVARLALAYPAAKVSDEEADARLNLYADALSDIPGDVLADACGALVRTSKFFPSASEIREKCGAFARRQWELSKIRALIATHDRNWRPDPEPLSDADKVEVTAILARIGASEAA